MADISQNFIAGIAPGGLKEVYEVKILICYLLHSLEKPLSADNINEIFSKDEAVDYFTFVTAMEELKASKHLNITDDKGTEYYTLTDVGIETALNLNQALPSSLREKVVKRGIVLLSRLRRESEVCADIVKKDNGFEVLCSIKDENIEYLSLKIYAPDSENAEVIAENFKNNSSDLYTNIIEKLT